VRRYVPAHLLDGRPHIVVDGAPRLGTLCTLSHWPRTPTPDALRADLSAEIALGALAHPDLVPDVEAVTIDHYDEDGVVSLGLLTVEGLAEAHGDLLVEAARVGDFGVVTDRRAALVAFALDALADPGRTPLAALGPGRRPSDWLETCALAATEALRLLPALADRPEDHPELWHDEAEAYYAAVAAMAEGRVSVEDVPDADLAVVRVPVEGSRPPTPTPASAPAPSPGPAPASTAHDGWAARVVHPAAVHSATTRMRVLTMSGRRYELRFRYETWVRLHSHRPRPRVDLSGLAAELSAAEHGAATWAFDGASALTPALHADRVSALGPDRFLDMVLEALADLDAGPPAWDPYGT